MIELCVQWRSIDLILMVTDYDASPWVPAKLNAAPEDCYPEEPAEVVINDGILKIDGPITQNSQDIEIMIFESGNLLKHILETQTETLQEKMFEELKDEY